MTYLEFNAYSPSNVPIFLAIKLLSLRSIEQLVNFSRTTGLLSESKKSLIITSKVPLLNEMLAIEILTSIFASSPSAIVVNLNKLYTFVPLNSDTTHGDTGD